MKTRTQVDSCISTFAEELSSFVHRTQDSISLLKRTLEQRPQAGGAVDAALPLLMCRYASILLVLVLQCEISENV